MPIQADELRPIDLDDLVRVGRSNDGGYVLPRTLIADCVYLVSYGLRADWSFERGIQRLNPSVIVHAYDHTLDMALLTECFVKFLAKSFLALIKIRPLRFIKHISDAVGLFDYFFFFSGQNVHFPCRVWYNNDRESITVAQTIEKVPENKPVLLKMDVERSEYRLIDDVIRSCKNIIGMVIEFHDIDIMNENFTSKILSLKKNFYICHIHVNNYGDRIPGCGLPDTLEIVFVSRRLFETPPRISTRTYPIAGLDQPNNPDEADFILDFARHPNGNPDTRSS